VLSVPALASPCVGTCCPPFASFSSLRPQEGVSGPAHRVRHPAYCARDRAQRPAEGASLTKTS
jgi:hypothetical protein